MEESLVGFVKPTARLKQRRHVVRMLEQTQTGTVAASSRGPRFCYCQDDRGVEETEGGCKEEPCNKRRGQGGRWGQPHATL